MLDYPQVILEFMNRDHAEFVSLREKLLGLLTLKSPIAEVDTLLDELHSHTVQHFAEEERQMQATQFPPYPMHKHEHDNVLADMASQIERWKLQRDVVVLRVWLEKVIGEWFSNHVSTMDFATSGFIKMNQ